jgi:hypothetical protein
MLPNPRFERIGYTNVKCRPVFVCHEINIALFQIATCLVIVKLIISFYTNKYIAWRLPVNGRLSPVTCLCGADPTGGGWHDGGVGLAGGSTVDGQNGQKKKRHA